MPVDQATLDKYISEVAGDDQELAGILRERIGSKETAASNFVRGFLRNADYTQKTQDLAKQRAQYESQQQDYEARLTQAEAEKDTIMRDLANERISASRASALLKTVKQAYSLTDADLPGIEDLKETARTGAVVDSTPNLDDRFAKFEEKLMDKLTKQLIPEISGLATLPVIWNDIEHEHQALFGKRLTRAEEQAMLKKAREENRSLDSVWQDTYNVTDKRLEVRDTTNKDKWRREWEDDQAKRNQEAALRGVSPESRQMVDESMQSPLFKRSFMPKDEQHETSTTGAPPPAQRSEPPPGLRGDASRERMSGADRAAARYLERRANGQIGKPLTDTRVPA